MTFQKSHHIEKILFIFTGPYTRSSFELFLTIEIMRFYYCVKSNNKFIIDSGYFWYGEADFFQIPRS